MTNKKLSAAANDNTKSTKPTKTTPKKLTATDIDDIFSHKDKLITNKRKSRDATADSDAQPAAKQQKLDSESDDDELSDTGYTTDDELRRIAAEVAAVKSRKQKLPSVKSTSFTSSSAAPSDDLGFTRSNTGPSRKRTEEGYRVYSEEELKITASSGDTKDCPFDCNCCF